MTIHKKNSPIHENVNPHLYNPEDPMVVRLLKRHKMSVTPVRKQILALFIGAEKALQHSDIEDALAGTIDRITVYRTLQTFVKKRLIHTIPTEKKSIQYAYGRVAEKMGKKRHVHFLCEVCGSTHCKDLNIEINMTDFQKRYAVRTVDITLRGICDNCATAH